jgi:hypothetical protein
MKADLHYHGPIGMHEPWLTLQGYKNRNLAHLIYVTANTRDIDIIAIISERKENIQKDSPHDRFNYLFEESQKLPNWAYKSKKLGNKDIAFVMQKESSEKPLYILNGQTVAVNESGKRYDHLVIGSNQIPNQENLIETIHFCQDKELIQILEHPFYIEHFGLGERLAEQYLKDYDAIEGHNSQMIWPEWISQIPKIGKANKGVNTKAQEFAQKYSIPWIATSDGHRIEDLGISYTEFNTDKESERNSIDFSNENVLLATLKNKIINNDFTTKSKYQDIKDWLSWTIIFQRGVLKGETSEVKEEFSQP